MTESETTPRANHHRLAPLLAALSAVGPLSVDTYLPSMVEIGRTLHASPVSVQQTLTAYMTPFAIMTLWHGAISDALGRRRVILWSTALFVLASVACACAHSIETLLIFRALQGMTAGAGMVVGRAIVRDLFSGAEAQRLMSHVMLVFAVAPAVAPIIGGRLQVWWGWRSVFVFLVLFGGVAWSLCRWILPETLPPERRRPVHAGSLARSYFHVLRSPAFLSACLAATLNFSGMFIYIVSAPVFMMQHMKVTETGFIWLFGPVTVGMAMGAFLSNRTAGRATAMQTIGWSYGLMAVATTINLLLNFLGPAGLPWSVMPLFVYVLGMSLAFPSLTLLALDLFPNQRGLAASCQSFVQTTGAAVNAVVAPRVWGSLRLLALYQSVMLCLAFGCYLLFLYVRQREQKAFVGIASSAA